MLYKLKNKAKHVAEKSDSADDQSLFKKCKNKLKAVVCQAKIDYLRSSVVQCRGCPKKAADMWSCISNVIGRAKPHKPVIDDRFYQQIFSKCYCHIWSP